MTSPSETAIDHQMAAEDENPQLAAPPAGWHLAATAVGRPAAEPEVVSRGDAESPVIFAVPDAEPESIPESPAVSTTAGMSTSWHEIQAMFVDDPRASAEMAAALVDDSIRALVSSVKEQQDSLLAAWHGEDAGTEELRTAVQHYRALGNRLADFSREI